MSRNLFVAISLALGYAASASPAPSRVLLTAPGKAVGDVCVVNQTRREVMDVLVKRDGVELTSGQGNSTVRDRYSERVVATGSNGKATSISRRYSLATRYRTHALPTGKATLSVRPIVGRDITVSLSSGTVLVSGAGKAEPDDVDDLRNALNADPGRLLASTEQAVGATWTMPSDAFSIFDAGATGSGSCTLDSITEGPGGPSAGIRFEATLSSVDAQGRHQDGTVTGTLNWNSRLRRATSLQYESRFDVRYKTTRGATVVEVTGRGRVRTDSTYTWTRVAGKPYGRWR